MIYPPDIIDDIYDISRKYKNHCMNKSVLLNILNTIYEASLATDELRIMRFRVAYADPIDLVSIEEKNDSINWIPYTIKRRFTAWELRRIAPSLNPDHSLIAVYNDNLTINGVLNCPNSVIKMKNNETLHGSCFPELFNVLCEGPGQLIFCFGSDDLYFLVQGKLTRRSDHFFKSCAPLSKMLQEAEFMMQNDALEALNKSDIYDNTKITKSMTLYSMFLSRVLTAMTSLSYGGTLIILPDSYNFRNELLSSMISIKYVLYHDKVWHKMVKWINVVRKKIELSAIIHESNDLMNDIVSYADFVANLSAVDGAVVLTNKCKLIGYGVEIQLLSNVDNLRVISNNSATSVKAVDFGTRHRSIFRLCSSLEEAIGFVVSQDGGVKAVKKDGESLNVWTDITTSIV